MIHLIHSKSVLGKLLSFAVVFSFMSSALMGSVLAETGKAAVPMGMLSDDSRIRMGNYEEAVAESQELYDKRPLLLRQMEDLDRAPVALPAKEGGVFISWRLLGTDPERTAFDVYRDGVKINDMPITGATNYVDKEGTEKSTYVIKTLLDGKETEETQQFNVLQTPYYTIPVGKKDGYVLDEVSVGDLDGDREYELILLRKPLEFSPTVFQTITKFPLFEAYEMDGTFMWSVNLGPNSADLVDLNFLVYDLDGDGKAEFVTKTAEGTVDGTGAVIGDVDKDGKTDYRDSLLYNKNRQYISQGPEFLSVFDGETGKELARTDYIARGDLNQWGGRDDMQNVHRASHALIAPAYLDGVHPSIVTTRGCWNTLKLKAYDYKNGELTERWSFDSLDNPSFAGQGNHQLEVADIDFDGMDEIIWGSAAYDQDGKGMYAYDGYGHGDAMHVGKFMPDSPDIFLVASVHEAVVPDGLQLREARTGETGIGVPNKADAGRGVVADIDPRIDGPVLWGAGGTGYFAYNEGKWYRWNGPALPMNFTIWWDGDLLREFADSVSISKYNWNTNRVDVLLTAYGCYSINGTKATPSLQADILGDWREEYILPTKESDALRVYTTNIPTDYRIYTLMHDPVYRMGVAWQNNHYAQPPHTGFFLAHQTIVVPVPEIYVLRNGQKAANPDLEGKGVNQAKMLILKEASAPAE